ncbi:MAG: putative 7-carboxy-7-deazaguanine synthase QueE [Clostridium sp.]|uniref:putative 7-carboxy-7-deazaguanine synthase QueE n=1 Tax=Clostridium sp. TaxID=1506 RepID=UPI003EE55C7D
MNVVEIFQSIDGEANRCGYITNFIRLAHCNLRCSYCDTEYALNKNDGVDMSIEEIIKKLDREIKNVTLTGGEPLLHFENASLLLKRLVQEGFNVSVETNGAIDLVPYINLFPSVSFIVDYKSPSSNMEKFMNLNNFNILRNIDCVKFVVGSISDLKKMVEIYNTTNLKNNNTEIFVSPIFNEIDPKDIVEFLIQNKLQHIRLQIQMHKVIWDPMMKGV